MIERSLSTGWIDSDAWLMEIVTTFPEISQMNFWTELNNGKHVRIEHLWTPYITAIRTARVNLEFKFRPLMKKGDLSPEQRFQGHPFGIDMLAKNCDSAVIRSRKRRAMAMCLARSVRRNLLCSSGEVLWITDDMDGGRVQFQTRRSVWLKWRELYDRLLIQTTMTTMVDDVHVKMLNFVDGRRSAFLESPELIKSQRLKTPWPVGLFHGELLFFIKYLVGFPRICRGDD
jgi:hypothetical protein